MARKNEHDDHCRSIAERLDSIVDGELYRDTDGNEWEYYDQDDDGAMIACMYEYAIEDGKAVKHVVSAYSYDDGETWTRGDNGEAVELEQVDLLDYFESSIYNIEYRVPGRHDDPTSVQIMIACGGPNIYIDTKSGDVELYWWSESGRYPMRRETIEAIDEYMTELYNC